MTGMGLTKRQADCLTAIRSYIDEHGCSPSFIDLCRLLDRKSKSTITRLLQGLQQRGYVQWTPYTPRSLRLTTLPPPASLRSAPSLDPSGACPRLASKGSADRASPTCGGVGWGLPPDLQARLTRFCAAHGDAEADVIADAVLLHLDALDRDDSVEDAEALAMFGAAFDGVTL